MNYFPIVLAVLFISDVAQAAVYLWSNQELRISPLQKLTNDEFSKIVDELEHPEVFFFRSPSQLALEMREVTDGFHSAYSPNGDLHPQNFTGNIFVKTCLVI